MFGRAHSPAFNVNAEVDVPLPAYEPHEQAGLNRFRNQAENSCFQTVVFSPESQQLVHKYDISIHGAGYKRSRLATFSALKTLDKTRREDTIGPIWVLVLLGMYTHVLLSVFS